MLSGQDGTALALTPNCTGVCSPSISLALLKRFTYGSAQNLVDIFSIPSSALSKLFFGGRA